MQENRETKHEPANISLACDVLLQCRKDYASAKIVPPHCQENVLQLMIIKYSFLSSYLNFETLKQKCDGTHAQFLVMESRDVDKEIHFHFRNTDEKM